MSDQLARDVSKKAYGIAMMLGVVALAIFGKVIWLQAFPDESAMMLGESKAFRAAEITPSRGQILSSDGSLLATSVPDYEIRWDSEAKYDQDEYRAKIDSLAQSFSKLLGDKTAGEYKKLFANARATHDRYKKITDHVDYNQLQQIKKFPLIRKGRMKSGFVFIEKSKRKKPFGALAARTIGLNREDNQVGLTMKFLRVKKEDNFKRKWQVANGAQ
jgi:cell division protein FtsI (penicillin-binding protein 3)